MRIVCIKTVCTVKITSSLTLIQRTVLIASGIELKSNLKYRDCHILDPVHEYSYRLLVKLDNAVQALALQST